MQFLHSVLKSNESVSAADVKTDDLPVNPISHILLTLKYAQNQANVQVLLSEILACISKIEVLYKGASVYSLNGADAFAAAVYMCNFEPWGVNAEGDDNDLRSMTFLIPFGRYLYNPLECYPASRRGELQMQTSFASSFTHIDGVSYQVETVQLLDANPEQYLRMTTLTATPSATGDMRIDLPIGNKISDLIMWGTTIPTGSTATTTIQSVQLEINHVERYYASTLFESLHNMGGIVGRLPGAWGNHIHQLDGAAYAQYMDSQGVKQSDHPLSNYLWMPFDILRDGTFALDTKGNQDVEVVINAGDTNALRVIPAEICSCAERSI